MLVSAFICIAFNMTDLKLLNLKNTAKQLDIINGKPV